MTTLSTLALESFSLSELLVLLEDTITSSRRFLVVAAASAAGHRVEVVPGPSALLAAWTVAGLPGEQVLFLGFLPRKAGARRRILEAQRGRRESFVVFESPRRVAQTLTEIREVLGDRPACLARELTKKHEEVLRGTVSTLAERLGDEPLRGECSG